MLGMIAIFVFWYGVIYRWWIAAAMVAAITSAVWMSASPILPLLAYAALALGVIVYLQTFVTIAYDIRKAGNVSV